MQTTPSEQLQKRLAAHAPCPQGGVCGLSPDVCRCVINPEEKMISDLLLMRDFCHARHMRRVHCDAVIAMVQEIRTQRNNLLHRADAPDAKNLRDLIADFIALIERPHPTPEAVESLRIEARRALQALPATPDKEEDLTGRWGVCSIGRIGRIEGRKQMPWGMAWIGTGLDGTPWSSRNPTLVRQDDAARLTVPATPTHSPDKPTRGAGNRVKTHHSSEASVIVAPEEFMLHTRNALRHALQGAIERGARSIIIDLAATSRMDSAGLVFLVQSQNMLRRLGGDLYLSRPGDNVQSLMDLVKLTPLFEFRDLPPRESAP